MLVEDEEADGAFVEEEADAEEPPLEGTAMLFVIAGFGTAGLTLEALEDGFVLEVSSVRSLRL